MGIDGTQSVISKNLVFNVGDAGLVANSGSELRDNTVYANKVGILAQFGEFIISNNNVFANKDYNILKSSTNIENHPE